MSVKTPTFKQLLQNPIHLLAFGFGSGLSKKAPGTMGTLAAIPLYYAMLALPAPAYLVILIIICIAGVWICGKTADDIGVHDHGGIVWDEFAGFLLTMYWVQESWQATIAGFILFRIFDIFKPWPINRIDRELRGGLGIMVDDLVAGLMAALCLYGLSQLLPTYSP